MDNVLRGKLEMDAAKGESYQRAWDNIIQPFFDAKQSELYNAFQNIETSNTNGLVTIKLQSNALAALKDEVHHYINTGKFAQKTLNEEESYEH